MADPHPYFTDDIQPLDAMTYVREHPERFLPGGVPSGWAIVSGIAEDALVLGATDVRMMKEEGWWILFSNVDWLNVPCRCPSSPTEAFHRLLGFPELAVNSHRHEILAAAFAKAVVTVSRTDRFVVTGDVFEEHQIWRRLDEVTAARAVAFLMEADRSDD
ncbi:MAG: hypothetical protein R3C49_07755 [Planctomycetaceae bacterium]